LVRTLQNRMILGVALIAIMGFLFYTAVQFFLPDRLITHEVVLVLQRSLRKTGLKINIGKVHWAGLNRIQATRISLLDAQNHSIPYQVGKIDLKINLLMLITNRLHPENALQEIELVDPRITLQHFQDGSWNYRRYFPPGKGKLQLQMALKIRNGTVDFIDYRYGRHRLQKINGKARFSSNSLLSWSAKGITNFNQRMQWSSQGNCRIDEIAGACEVKARHVAAAKLAPFIPPIVDYRVSSGFTDIKINIAWNNDELWLNNGVASLWNVAFTVPQIKDPFVIKQLEAEFSPTQWQVNHGCLLHHRTVIKVSGLINNKMNRIKGELSAEQVGLAELNQLLPKDTKTSLQGEGKLRLTVGGTLNNPIIDGEAFINNARLVLAGVETVNQIAGRMTIRKNNLKIQRLEGSWHNSLVVMKGTIYNLFNPRLNLQVYGSGLNPGPEVTDLLSKQGFRANGSINLDGKITGKPMNPDIVAELSVEQLFYQEVAFNALRTKLQWDVNANSLRILELQGNIWDGHFTAKGEVRVNTGGVRWRLSSRIADVNLALAPFSDELGLGGKVSSDLVLKGNWQKGTSFQYGNVLGILNGKDLAYKDLLIDEAKGAFSWLDGKLDIHSIELKIDRGMIYGHLSWNPADLAVNLYAENVRIQQLLPDNRLYPVGGFFNGSCIFEGPLKKVTGRIDGVFSEVSWGDRPIGTIKETIDYSPQGLIITQALVSTDTGDYRVTGRVDLGEEAGLALQITGNNIKLSGLPTWFPAIAAFKPSGTAQIDCSIKGPFDDPQIQGEASFMDPSFGPLHMEQGNLKVSGDLGQLTISEFNLTSRTSQISINGSVNQNQLDLTVNGSALQLGSLQLTYGGKTLEGTIDVRGSLRGDITNPFFEALIGGKELSFGSLYFKDLAAQINWHSQILEIDLARLSRDQTEIALSGTLSFTENTPLYDLDLRVSTLSLRELLNNTYPMPANLEADGQLDGFIKIAGNFSDPEISIRGTLSQGTFNDVPVNGEFDLAYSNRKVTIERLLLNQGNGTLLANGVWENGQHIKIELGLQDFPCQAINPFINPAYKLAGVANAFAIVEWSNSKINGDYRLVINSLALNQYQLGDLSANGDLSNQGLSVSEAMISRKDGFLNAKGYIPWDPALINGLKIPLLRDVVSRNLNMTFNFKNLPGEQLNFFESLAKVLSGSLDGNLKLSGALNNPQIVGNIDANDLSANVVGLPGLVENFQASVVLDGAKATIERARGTYGHGRFNISGNATYDGSGIGDLDLALTGSNIFYSNSFFDGYGDLNLKLQGPKMEPLLSGDAKIFDSRISVSGSTSRDTSLSWDPKLDIAVSTKDNVRYRQMGLADVTLNGKIQVQGKLSDPKIEGEASSKQGILTFYGQTFKVNQGKAVFKYSQGILPYIDVNSSLQYPKAEIFLTAKGQVGGDVAINLTSQPFMSRADLFAMLNWPELNDEQKPLTVNEVVAGNISFLTDTIFGDFLYQIRNTLNIDYLYLEPNYQQSDLSLHVGRNVGKDLFLSYTRSFADTSKEQWGLDYQIDSHWSLGGNYSVVDGTSWRLIYQIGLQ
jgi:autotransporter translocation and assembly factor TamB